jgi:hypothetical protein
VCDDHSDRNPGTNEGEYDGKVIELNWISERLCGRIADNETTKRAGDGAARAIKAE